MTRKQKQPHFLEDAIDDLCETLRTTGELSALSVKLDSVASELAQWEDFEDLEGSDEERLDALLSYIEEDDLAEIAEELYELSADYKDQGSLKPINKQLEELGDGLRALSSKKPHSARKK
jgi:hypothetical protein